MLREDRARAGNTAFYGRNERLRQPFTASCFHGNLLFHRDLAVLVGVQGNADVSEIKHTWVNDFARVRFSNQRSGIARSHFLQEDLSAGVVSGSVVSKCQDVIGPVLVYVQAETQTRMSTSSMICVQKRLKRHQRTSRGR